MKYCAQLRYAEEDYNVGIPRYRVQADSLQELLNQKIQDILQTLQTSDILFAITDIESLKKRQEMTILENTTKESSLNEDKIIKLFNKKRATTSLRIHIQKQTG